MLSELRPPTATPTPNPSPQGGGEELAARLGRPTPDRHGPASRLRPPQHLPRGHGRLALRVVLHPPAAGGVLAAEREVDAALVFHRPALHHRPIGLGDAPALEQPAELGQRLAVAAEHEAARRVAIEPMRERGRARQAEPQRAEMVFEALAALGALVHGETRRLVDHQHQAVAVEQASGDLFRGHGHLPRFGETAITTVLVSRFRRSYRFAAPAFTNVGNKGTLATYGIECGFASDVPMNDSRYILIGTSDAPHL